MSTKILRISISALSFLLIFGIAAANAEGQRRDYLTDEEIELVRDAQDIDLRINVLTTAIDRRFEALNITFPELSKRKLDDKWGPAPHGTRLELLDDIKRLLRKAIDDIDDVAQHKERITEDGPPSEKQKKKQADRFPNAVNHLAAAAQRYKTVFKSMDEKIDDPRERGAVFDSIDFCDQIIEAAATLHKS